MEHYRLTIVFKLRRNETGVSIDSGGIVVFFSTTVRMRETDKESNISNLKDDDVVLPFRDGYKKRIQPIQTNLC